MKLLKINLLWLMLLTSMALYCQDKVDVGIFSGTTPDTLIIKARPNYQIPGQSVTNGQLTIKWSETSTVTELQWLFTTIGLYPQGPVSISDGFRYQVYGSFGGSSLNWLAGQEYVILKLRTNSQTGDCTEFEIARDDWTMENNGDYYFEILGEDRTGDLYVPAVNFGSEGGYVDGDTTIYLGGSTGIMTLNAYNGNILQWERKINQGQWGVLPGTAGLSSYEDIPTLQGTWEYRAKVEKTGCLPQYSDHAIIQVELLAVWTGAVDTHWNNPGNWNVTGIPDAALDGRIPELSGAVYPSIDEEASCKNLLIDENASLTISEEGTLTLSGFLENQGLFLMRSDTSSSASFIDNGLDGNGTFIDELIIQPYHFHLISSPVIHSTNEAFEGMDISQWEEPVGQWVPLTSSNDTLKVFSGYLVMSPLTGNNKISLQGSGFNTGPLMAELTNNGNANGHAGGFNLIGNPYPSAMNWNDTENLVLDQVDPAIYIFDGEAGNYGTYLANDPGSSTLGIDSLIGHNQGFFVHVSHNAFSGSLSVNNNLRVHDHRALRRPSPARSTEPYLKLKVTQSAGPLMDEAVVRFLEGATTAFDSQSDAYDISGSTNSPQLFSRCPDTLRLAVNTYPSLLLNTTIPLGFLAGMEDDFTLNIGEMLNFGTDTLVLLEDLKMDTIYQLTQGFTLNFQASPGDMTDRFLLHFRVEPVIIPVPAYLPGIVIILAGKSLEVTSPEAGFAGVLDITDLSGRIMLSKDISGLCNRILCPFPPGLYLVRITKNDKSLMIKKICLL